MRLCEEELATLDPYDRWLYELNHSERMQKYMRQERARFNRLRVTAKRPPCDGSGYRIKN